MSENKSTSTEKMLYCSFCGKSQNEVKKLIAGPSVYICDECIDLCNDIIREELLSSGQDKENGSELPTPKERNRRKKYFLSPFTIITNA